MDTDWLMTVFGWVSEPTAWAGLAMLVVLEIVLGIDNLVFIAILTEKLPANQQSKARYTGLSFALMMRLILLATISWIVTLTKPLFTILGNEISGRDIVLIVGGLFLLLKGTMELHERLEGFEGHRSGGQSHEALFWVVIAQIVVLDAVFSLDSVITAVGMVKELPVMMLAVIIAVGAMMAASNPLMNFVSRHPTVVILCLGFLLMIGFSLIVEGVGIHVPKGYLYTAIAFSVVIETFNQIAQRNARRFLRPLSLRDSTARAVLRLLGGEQGADMSSGGLGQAEAAVADNTVFAPEEREMIRQVIKLGGRNMRDIMVPRPQIFWLDLNDSSEIILKDIEESGHTVLPVCQDDVDNVVGILRTKDLLTHVAKTGELNIRSVMVEPLFVAENTSVVRLIEYFKASATHMAIVVDEHGTVEGLATPADILGVIAGELAGEEGEEVPDAERRDDGSWVMDGQILIDEALRLLGIDTAPPGEGDYSTLAGFVLFQTGHLPDVGETFSWENWQFRVESLDGRRVETVVATPETALEGAH
ncbi:MAG: TerC family protein [Methylobacteriaceae bacterium]|jgi:CBS domain containing-hemolysin-like protein|nr:TerC family protein [Methylobacteriaceae bacterium]